MSKIRKVIYADAPLIPLAVYPGGPEHGDGPRSRESGSRGPTVLLTHPPHETHSASPDDHTRECA
ncbi:hypothetical protein GCM10010121_099470 [Streptomyces brasiliensis]|uniref:Uncharacterized protein n=1 Tax=Streptomyces brasiliensis TaxID=1954 RepID=A0A917PEN3_9ACTN|nr:hypothetical protein GCM10010121_099470 [Streptomyces brasiliensis]